MLETKAWPGCVEIYNLHLAICWNILIVIFLILLSFPSYPPSQKNGNWSYKTVIKYKLGYQQETKEFCTYPCFASVRFGMKNHYTTESSRILRDYMQDIYKNY
uniref:Uncharacterized protein n=1 Tax=Porodaedalea pini TaxID=108901 RepID=A0A5B9RCD2_9AGAM|nr:hypothetical protein PPIT_000085 [Porodaedalea pini]QEG56969.1 hypothetical protein PPIT_000085 [Porodaedalea pini]